MLTKLGRRVNEHSENFNKRQKKHKKLLTINHRAEDKIIELKNSKGESDSRLSEAEERISKLKDKEVAFIKSQK